MKKAPKVVVTGGAGFIGSHLVDALLAQGFEVHVVDTYVGGRYPDRLNADAIYHEVDIRDQDALAPIIAGSTYVFHQAALPRVQFSIDDPLQTMAVNVTGTAHVLRAAHLGGVKRVVCASSSAVYGDQPIMPLVESMLPAPKSPYGLHKYMLERMCRVWSDIYALQTVALRYFNVYGTRMDPEGAYALAIPKFLKQRSEDKPITIWGDGSQSRDFIHVSDVVRANLLAATSERVGSGEVINIGSGRKVSISDLAQLIGGPVVYEEERLEPRDTLADSARAASLLGWLPTIPLEEGIAELKKAFALT